MKNWMKISPERQVLGILSRLQSCEFLVDIQASPIWETIFIRDREGCWLAICWDYADVEFKFEIYHLSIERPLKVPAEEKLSVGGCIPRFSKVRLLTRSEWVRPAAAGEVPLHYEQVVEEAGRLADVPDSATAAGTALFGIGFLDEGGDPLLGICIDNSSNYCVKKFEEPEELNDLFASCDCFSLQEWDEWNP